jgi:hypothetical protein
MINSCIEIFISYKLSNIVLNFKNILIKSKNINFNMSIQSLPTHGSPTNNIANCCVILRQKSSVNYQLEPSFQFNKELGNIQRSASAPQNLIRKCLFKNRQNVSKLWTFKE